MTNFPKFGQEDFDKLKLQSCADDSCDVNFIVSRPVVSSGGDGGCCDCPPGPPGPPGPRGAKGDPGDGGPCPKVYAGPLLPPDGPGIDEQAFQDLMESRGYIVQLSIVGGNYSQAEIDADVFTYPNSEIQYVQSSDGTLSGGLQSNEEEFWPFAYETIGANGIGYYNHTPTFGQFLEMCGLRDSTGTTEQRRNFYKTGNNRLQIPSLINCVNAPTVPAQGLVPRTYTFVSRNSSAIGGSNGPYYLEQFKNTVNGIINGTIRSDDFQGDNPAILTNLGHQIVKSDGTVGVAYDCQDCIQGPPDSNILDNSGNLNDCDVFIDTQNGVMYSRDEAGDWPSGAPRFNPNGIPLRVPFPDQELPLPPPRIRKETVLIRITNSTRVITNPDPNLQNIWVYTYEIVDFNPSTLEYNLLRPGNPGTFAYNSCEVLRDKDGIGQDQFINFPNNTIEMLPIRNGIVVVAKKDGQHYIFSVPNAYKAGCV